MTNEELTAIEARVTAISTAFSLDVEEALWESAQDVPALVAEVRRLRAERDADLAASPALHDALVIAEGQRDQARAERDKLRDQWSGLLLEQARLMAMRDAAVQQRDDAIAERDALRKVDVATVIRFLVGYTQYEDNYSTDFSHSAAVRAGLNAALAVQP